MPTYSRVLALGWQCRSVTNAGSCYRCCLPVTPCLAGYKLDPLALWLFSVKVQLISTCVRLPDYP